ncbi:Protein OBERON 3 [Hibiscus syriacus]|uniref:Protein OBERON 3 n=1 Tax=Hibiscus syriacus TaxID=106335 RepID=A0A6A2YVA3_HIBSY|nr:protein OBERON 3-like [Hibiscus syriacus]KAE8682995.1 Protein OBERON 3 [Hibiscus syriacus]
MFGEKDLSSNHPCVRDESSQSKLSRLFQNKESPVEKTSFSQKGIDFLGESKVGLDGGYSLPRSSQELTLSYLCENSKLGFVSEKELAGKTYKGKEVVDSDNSNQDEKWVERDFLNLSESKGISSKRDVEEDFHERENFNSEKRPKLETLNLSLALPDVSLSLTTSNALQNGDPSTQHRSRPSRSVQSLAPSTTNNTQTTCSNDFTAASLSYSYSVPFSHNPSCSLTRNSTENYEYSVGKDDQIWCGGEGTNGSVHSRFRPIGDGVALAGAGVSGGFSIMQANRHVNKDSCNSLHRTTSSDNHSFFPSELLAKPGVDNHSGDSRKRDSENWRVLDSMDGGRSRKISRPERILLEIVSESIPSMVQMLKELPDETLELTKEYLRNLISTPERKEDLVVLQSRLERRSDLIKETLSKCCKGQLEILVAVKMGLKSFLSGKVGLPMTELVEIFLFTRCRNLNCKSVLPVDDCDCKICSGNKGFCSSCMCPVCLTFDCASNTCSWVGCDVCSHWCHVACGIQRNLIKPGPSIKGPSGTTEMQFHCMGCGHASEMFGFVKDVFLYCAKDWGHETLIKELDCVRKIFRGSDDSKGKELRIKADDLCNWLRNEAMSTSDACSIILQFFNHIDGLSDFPPTSGACSKELTATQVDLRKDESSVTPGASCPQKLVFYSTSSSSGHDLLQNDLRQKGLKPSHMNDLMSEDEYRFGRSSNTEGFDSIEGMVRIKEAEAILFQSKADEARREVESYMSMIRTKSAKLEEEYTEKLSKLCLQETEERRRNKMEELKVLEHSHCDYYKMKLRMQAEIASLLERMEATKQQWA